MRGRHYHILHGGGGGGGTGGVNVLHGGGGGGGTDAGATVYAGSLNPLYTDLRVGFYGGSLDHQYSRSLGHQYSVIAERGGIYRVGLGGLLYPTPAFAHADFGVIALAANDSVLFRFGLPASYPRIDGERAAVSRERARGLLKSLLTAEQWDEFEKTNNVREQIDGCEFTLTPGGMIHAKKPRLFGSINERWCVHPEPYDDNR